MSLHAYADLLFVPLWRVSEFSFRLMILALFNCLYIYISWSRVASLQLSLFGLLPPEAARMLCLQQCVLRLTMCHCYPWLWETRTCRVSNGICCLLGPHAYRIQSGI